MKLPAIVFSLLCTLPKLQAQNEYTSLGGGYSVASFSQEGFSEFILQVNNLNPQLTSRFTTENLFRGYNLFAGFRNDKSLFTASFSQLKNHYRAEGVLPIISPNSATYNIGLRHTSFSGQLNWFPVRFLGFGAEIGYTYSTIRNEQKDLFFGETNAVVDKKGGLHAGVNAILQIPIGSKIFIQVQPCYLRYLYKNDMDNVARIYLGTSNSAATETAMSSVGGNVKIGLKIE